MRSDKEGWPLVSVVMPIRNEVNFVEESVGAVLAQDYPPNRMEIVVVDGMSDDGTREVVRRIMAAQQSESYSTQPRVVAVSASFGSPASHSTPVVRHRPGLVMIDNPARTAPAGLNAGIGQARGDIVVRVDGHAIIRRDYVRSCVEALLETGAECVGGAVESVGGGYVGEAIAQAMSSPFGVGGSRFRVSAVDSKPVLTDTVPFPAFRRGVFERIGLYDERMVRHQDYEFNYRLRKDGGRILLLPSLRVTYHVRSSLQGLWRQYWQYGIYKGTFLRAHPASIKFRHLVPPLFVLAIMVSTVLAAISQIALLALAVAVGAYAAFVLAAVVALCRRGKLNYAPIMPVVLACLHFSYGFGIWLGLASTKVPRRG